MTVLEYDGQLLIVDCGVLFPEDHQPGVDLILPDFDYIADRLDDIEAIVLTHGHEDHIGAVPYLLRLQAGHPADRLPADPRAGRGQAQGAPDHARTRLTVQGGPARAARPLRLRVRRGQPLDPRRARRRHPHPGRHACCTPATSRWTSCRSTAGSPTCAPSPGSARRASTCSWSTRPTPRSRASPRPSATSARPSTGSSRQAQRRVIVACFSSHVHRVQQVLDAADAPRPQGRPGRPLDGAQHGHRRATSATSRCPTACSSTSRSSTTCRDDQVVLMCTGSQGEPMAALSRMANRDHQIEVGEGDTVILASQPHPRQRERRLPRHQRPDPARRQRRAQGQRQGARLRPRQRRRAALLLQHRQAAQRDAGARRVAPPGRQRRPRRRDRRPARPTSCIGEDGVVVDLVDGVATIVGAVALRLRLRRRLARRRDHRGAAEGPPDPARRGLHLDHRRASTRPPARSSRARRSRPAASPRTTRSSTRSVPRIERGARRGRRARASRDTHELQQVVRRMVGRWVGGKLRRRPMIIPVVIEA